MQLSQSYDIPVPVQTAWEALNDAEILAQAIPGCEELKKISDTQLSAKVKLKIGPVSAIFTGEVTLSDLAPPHAYVISGSGKGGVAGSASGLASAPGRNRRGGATRLTYEVEAAVTGKIAQLGSRLIEIRQKAGR